MVKIGDRFGKWTVVTDGGRVKRYDASGGSRPFWICRCDCGTERRVAEDNLRSGGSTSCGCANAANFPFDRSGRRYILPPGTRFGRWIVGADAPQDGSGKAKVFCRCDGCDREFKVEQQNLLRSLSVGCRSCSLRDSFVGKGAGRKPPRIKRTQLVRPPEYSIWKDILRRCRTNPRYIARGVCAEWATSFDRFLADVGPRPSPDHSIDRIDNEKGYEPGNVRWATDLEQARNKGDNRKLTAFGQTKCMSEWALKIDVAQSTIHARLARGWSVEKAVSTRRLNGRRRLRNVQIESFKSAALVGMMGMSL